MKKAAIYNRKSQEAEDRQVLSVESQYAENTALAERNDYTTSQIAVFNECRSAHSPGRPEFARLMAKVAAGEIDTIFCWKLDRLARNAIDGGTIIWAIRQYGLKIITSAQTYGPDDDNKILMYVEFGMADKYSDDLSRNVKRGNRTKLENGWLPGKAPLGYLNDRVNKTIIKDPERFHLVRKMWDLLLDRQLPVSRVIEFANHDWGFRTLQRRKSGGGPISRYAGYALFKNPFYCGKIIRKGREYSGSHPPMITEGEFERAQEILGRKRQQNGQIRHHFAFTGMIKCRVCNGYITAEEQVNKYGSHYVYYRCGRRKKGFSNCSNPPISLKKLEKQITAFLEKIHISPEIKDYCLRELRRLNEKESKDRTAIVKSQQEAIRSNQKKLDNLIDLRCRDLLSDEEYIKMRDALQSEQKELKEKRLSSEYRARNWFELCEKVFEFASQAVSCFETGTLEEKRIILDTVGANFVLNDRELFIEAQKPYLILAKRGKNPGWWGILESMRTFFLDVSAA